MALLRISILIPLQYDVNARVDFEDKYAELGLESSLRFMSERQAQRVLSSWLSTIAAFADEIIS